MCHIKEVNGHEPMDKGPFTPSTITITIGFSYSMRVTPQS